MSGQSGIYAPRIIRCPELGIMAFVHVSIRARNMERSIRFYETHFGMKLASRRPIPQNNAEIAFLESAAQVIFDLQRRRETFRQVL